VKEAREAAKKMPVAARYHHDLLEAAVGLRPTSELDRMAHEAVNMTTTGDDPKPWLEVTGTTRSGALYWRSPNACIPFQFSTQA
jgi:hypothetical protein